MLVSAFAVGAITLDTAESAEASYIPEAALAADTPDIPLYSQYGELIYYSDMETENESVAKGIAESTWYNPEYMTGVAIEKAGGTLTKHADPENAANSVILLAGSTSWHQYVGYFGDLYPKEGKYTVVYDTYVPSTLPDGSANANANGWMSRFFTSVDPQKADGTAVAGDSISLNTPASADMNKVKNVWRTLTYAGVVDAYDGGYTFGMDSGTKYYYPDNADGSSTLKISEFRLIPNAASVYIDNVRVYYMPENGVSFKFGNSSTMKTFEGDTYVLPEPAAVDASWTGDFYGWIIDGAVYDAGEEVSASVVGGKKVVALEIPLFDAEKGDLVFFYNYDGDNASNINPTYMNPDYLTTIDAIRSDGTDGYPLGTDIDNGFVRVHSAQNMTFRLYGPCFDKSSPILVNAYYTVNFDYEYKTPVANGANNWVRLNPNTGNEWDNDIAYTRDADGVGFVEISKKIPSGIKAVNLNFGSKQDAESGVYYPTEVNVDNLALYAFPTAKFVFKDAEDSENYAFATADGETYVMPAPEAIGLDIADFVCWTDGFNYYYAGETVNVAASGGKVYYPFSQSADMPAVVSIFEGNTKPSVSKVAYTELIEEDGRDVLHGHFWKSTWTTDKYMNDTRIALTHPGFDAGEYSIINIMSKAPEAYNTSESNVKDTDVYEARTSTSMNLYNYINSSYAYNGNSRIGSYNLPVDNEYHLTEINMGENENSSYPWETTGFGFALDPNCVNYGGDFYIDYVRIYRSGITTVTYDTNAPAGATVVSEVPADENRGLGTGYLLKDVRPVVEGYIFLGWAESADATASDVVTAIDLTEDATVYAVWEEADTYKAAEMNADKEIRSGGSVNGIRFKAAIAPSAKEKLDEIGFIATREVLLPVLDETAGTYDYTALDFGYLGKEAQKEEDAPLYVYGVAYNKAEGVDIINGDGADGSIIYTAVMNGIPLENKNEKLVVRSYAKFAINGNAVTVYSAPEATSLYETAKAVKDAGGEAYENNKAYIDSIVTE